MARKSVEDLANEVHACYNPALSTPDLMRVAASEGIALAPGQYGEKFYGRIEYHKRANKFILYHPQTGNGLIAGRTRFSIGHELGHYFIPWHYEALLTGQIHNSLSGFICENKLEREADEFASLLLIPTVSLKQRLNQEGFMTLRKILDLANHFQTSATCAAIRYAKVTHEACAVLLSNASGVLYYIPSTEAVYKGFGRLSARTFPIESATADAHQNLGSQEIQKLETNAAEWGFQGRDQTKVWEEAFSLGYTNLALTLLAFEQ